MREALQEWLSPSDMREFIASCLRCYKSDGGDDFIYLVKPEDLQYLSTELFDLFTKHVGVEISHESSKIYPRLPSDWAWPKWNEEDRVHNWRNYVTDDLKEIWETFGENLQKMLAILKYWQAMRTGINSPSSPNL